MIKDITATSACAKIKYTLEDNDECWFSSHNEEQLIEIQLNEARHIKKITIEYQKGFECEYGELFLIEETSESKQLLKIENEVHKVVKGFKIKLIKGKDLYNRFCIYRIKHI